MCIYEGSCVPELTNIGYRSRIKQNFLNLLKLFGSLIRIISEGADRNAV